MRFVTRALITGLAVFAVAASTPVAHALTVPPRIDGNDLVNGSSIRMEPRGGDKLTVVVFLSSRCPCSMSHEPVLAQLAKDFAKEARFIGIHSNADEPASESGEHFRRAALPFPVVQDDVARLANAFGALKTPHAYVLSSRGEVVFQGGVDDSHDSQRSTKPYLRSALEALRAGREPEITLARSLGCTIKR